MGTPLSLILQSKRSIKVNQHTFAYPQNRIDEWLGCVAALRNGELPASLADAGCSRCGTYFDSFTMASAALPATTQFADPATTASSSNQRYPKSSMHSGKFGLMMTYPGITAPGMYELSARLLLYVFIFETVPTPATYEVLDTGCVPRM